jgi:hypothetical protein
VRVKHAFWCARPSGVRTYYRWRRGDSTAQGVSSIETRVTRRSSGTARRSSSRKHEWRTSRVKRPATPASDTFRRSSVRRSERRSGPPIRYLCDARIRRAMWSACTTGTLASRSSPTCCYRWWPTKLTQLPWFRKCEKLRQPPFLHLSLSVGTRPGPCSHGWVDVAVGSWPWSSVTRAEYGPRRCIPPGNSKARSP